MLEEAAAHADRMRPSGKYWKQQEKPQLTTFMHKTYWQIHAPHLTSAEHRSQPTATAHSQPSSYDSQYAKSCPDAPTQPITFAKAVTILVALGIWDTSIAQALADQVSQRRRASIQYHHDHGMRR